MSVVLRAERSDAGVVPIRGGSNTQARVAIDRDAAQLLCSYTLCVCRLGS